MNATPKRYIGLLLTLLPAVFALAAMVGCQGISNNTSTSVKVPTQSAVAGDLSVTPGSVNFSNVQMGASQSQAETLSNIGASSVTITQAPVTGAGFSVTGLSLPLTLAAGQSTNFSVTFSPKTAGSASGTLAITSNASNPTLAIPLSGTAASPLQLQLAVAPTTLSLGSVTVGTSGSATGTLTATGGDVTVTSAISNNSRFALSGLSLPVTIPEGQSVSFAVAFSPQTAGAASATLTFASNAYPSTTVADLSGTGTTTTGQLAATPTSLSLGNVVVGASGTASGTLSATGANVTITAASSSNAHFALSGISLPITIQAGQSAQFTVTFSPQTTGAASATLTFASDASPSTTADALTGTGTTAPAYTVNLSWNASTSSDIVGYNVYRSNFGTACGSYAKLNSALNPSTSYGDSSVADGQTYCYVTTAVNGSNQESAYSAVVEATIPAP
jgi:Abnormal spindle-like microcephaly-assoc'd, ASPM-SPD-2-Hydin